MQDFLEYERIEPRRRDTVERIKDFKEIYKPLNTKDASSQSSRCVQCSNPYCSHGCPLDNHIPQWLLSVAKNDIDMAFAISNQTSPFPEIMGKVCPQDRLCEKTCTLNTGLGAVTIGAIENHINQEGFKKGLKIPFLEKKVGKKIAVIGSGPAGLSVATFLLRAGVDVDVYESLDRAGGLLTYGIPGFKLDKNDVQRRVDMLTENGMGLHLNTTIGKDVEFKELIKNYDGVFIGIGAKKQNTISIPNISSNGVHQAMEVLTDIQKSIFSSKRPTIDLANKKVVVIGGGDTAMDCVRTSIRQKSSNVKCLYRRDEKSMPGSLKEHNNAKLEGVDFIFHLSPKEIVVDDNNNVKSIIMQKTKFDDNNKLITLDECEEIQADIIILALGFNMQVPNFIKENNISLSDKQTLKLNNYRTSIDKVYAGGDCFRGADLVVNAALDGREASKIILKDLGLTQ
ncbi:Glutamate synthase [NADPH] small chain [hydrothermal vent metagenome]|uniref:Glutamate synthase [NADPH] small chain n=1 Tax=hydrothermal vent metagenome TaxID=652676 RepID=A0A3B1EA18_9ZZZZ